VTPQDVVPLHRMYLRVLHKMLHRIDEQLLLVKKLTMLYLKKVHR